MDFEVLEDLGTCIAKGLSARRHLLARELVKRDELAAAARVATRALRRADRAASRNVECLSGADQP